MFDIIRLLIQQSERVELGFQRILLVILTTLENKTEIKSNFSQFNKIIYNINYMKYTFIFQNKNKLKRVANLFHVLIDDGWTFISVVIHCFC